jgi:thiaminase
VITAVKAEALYSKLIKQFASQQYEDAVREANNDLTRAVKSYFAVWKTGPFVSLS